MVRSWGSGECAVHNFFPSAPTIVFACKKTCTNTPPSPDTACGAVICSAILYVGFLQFDSKYICPFLQIWASHNRYNTYTHTEKCNRNLLLLKCFGLCTPTQGLYLVWSVIFGYGMFLLNHLDVQETCTGENPNSTALDKYSLELDRAVLTCTRNLCWSVSGVPFSTQHHGLLSLPSAKTSMKNMIKLCTF